MFDNKSILVTGGTGSFGKKFISTIIQENRAKRIIVYSRDELKQQEMRISGFNSPNVRFFIGDVRDLQRLKRAFNGVDFVVHAAALKQVPTCEYNPIEAIMTNVIGTKNVIDAAIDSGVKKVLLLSTDKAVNPANLYGGTKLVAEKLMIQSNVYAGNNVTRFSCTRYGNVVGSRGSVIPLFIQQRRTGQITLTDERMTRFWISLDQGVKFVITCLKLMEGGEVFVPKIPSMKMIDLAQVIAPDSRIKKIGIRPGEKIHEILISKDEGRNTIELDNMYVVQPPSAYWFGYNWETKGKKLPDGFYYSSDNNKEWLSCNDLKEIISPLERSF